MPRIHENVHIIDGKRIAFKLKMIPIPVLHFVEKILIHMSGFQFHDFGRDRPDSFFLDSEPAAQELSPYYYNIITDSRLLFFVKITD